MIFSVFLSKNSPKGRILAKKIFPRAEVEADEREEKARALVSRA